MRKIVSILLLLIVSLSLFAIPALAVDAPVAETTTDTVTTLPTITTDPTIKINNITDKAITLGAALVPLMITVGAVVFMVSLRTGGKMIGMAVGGALIVMGGYKLIIDIIQYFVS